MRELFLTSFDGTQYGIWKDEILAVRDIKALHRIPLSPARIAGIMIEDGCTVTLGDFPACIGLEPTRGNEQGCILLKQQGEKVIGFVLRGELRTQSIQPEKIFPLPGYLKSQASDTCAVHGSIPIPVINIADLYSGLFKTGDTHQAGWLQIPEAKPQDISGILRLRFTDIAGDVFAVSAVGIGNHAASLGPVTPLPNAPQYVLGVTFHNGHLLPVIDLALRIKSQRATPDSVMLTAVIADAAFGLLIDKDAGSLPADKVSIKPAPKITWNSWLRHVVVRDGELIPLVDLAIVLTPDTSGADNAPVWQRHVPDSSFPEKFFRHDAEVVEFSLLGERYALPKQEVEDDIAFKTCRELPDVPPIVVGLAEHDGEILPVIDPAMMFGRRSVATSGWRMMLVNNGDFRALVITEKVFGERRLPVSLHRAVPVHLPHNLMYGCYPDERAVRIILNVEAISVHFEKSLIQAFMPALSKQMRMSPTGVVYTFPGEMIEHADEVGPNENPATEEKVKEKTLAPQSMNQSEATNTEYTDGLPVVEAEGFNEESKSQEFVAAESVNPTLADLAATPSQAAQEFKRRAEIDDAEFVEWEEEAIASQNAAGPVKSEAVDAKVSEQPVLSDKAVAAAGAPETATPEHDVIFRGQFSGAAKPREPGRQSPPETLGTSTRKRQVQNATNRSAIDKRVAEPVRATTSARTATPYRMSREVEHLATLSGNENFAASTRKRNVAYVTIAALLTAVLVYYAGNFDKSALETSILSKEPPKATQAQPEQSFTENLPAKEQLQPPLELDIPKNRPVGIDVYVVQEGDTLWSISERFTGNPFNYPRIAGENRIADPDLIFPEQRIRLVK